MFEIHLHAEQEIIFFEQNISLSTIDSRYITVQYNTILRTAH